MASTFDVYNSRILYMLKPQPGAWVWSVALALLLSVSAGAENWTQPAQQLAGKVAAVTGPGAVSVEVNNRSSLNKNDADAVRRILLTELAALGLRFVNPELAAATVKVSLSEDLRNYLLIAEIRQGTNEPSVVMVSAPRAETQTAGHESPMLVIRKTLLWQSRDRILDVAIMSGGAPQMSILYPEQVLLYKVQDGHWQPEQSLSLNHPRPWPRDLRGRLVPRKDHLFDAYLPGMFCQSSPGVPLALNCRTSDDPWPLGIEQFELGGFFTPSRNFFTGALSPGINKQRTAPAFYSAAPVPRQNYTLWLFAAVDGQIHMLDGVTDQVAPRINWGSDIASVHSGCGSGWQVLTSENGVEGVDSIRAYELADREPTTTGQPLQLAGIVSDLWTQANGNSAVVVTHDVKTGHYEAFQLTIACAQ
jgi:hypothetical protein